MLLDNKEDVNRTAIIEAATLLFKKYGYTKLVMDDIAKAVHKGRSTLYIYFKNKEELFNTILQKETDTYFNELEAQLPHHASATDKLLVYCRTKFQFIHAKTNEYLILTKDLLEHPEILFKVRRLCEPRETQLISSIIQQGVENKEFQPLQSQQMELLASVLISAFRGVIDDFCLSERTCDIEPVQELVEMLLLKALTHN
ncbi:TetR/AcrR family transcriptional regulator [Mucilaginibacter robiniae]|uniref:TetR/AcrR family transcriptional regulator n=1 Tax=Mucilaginibacter robiniae TaxID=2728022 RepID=A0A7L5E5G4_9SPHI|nr:TetR/AcrR family transcriptional regulator [Mucilaginibacter robiniae]QJD97004.1 TetR/AcrR family transcriptional regulator [Mucilaginibacter robiniae]